MPIVTEKNNRTTLGKLHAQKIKQRQFATTDTAIRDHGNFRSNPWSRTIGDLGVSSVAVSRALTLKGSRNPLLTLAFVVGPHLHERKGYSGLWGNLGSSRVSWNDDSAVH